MTADLLLAIDQGTTSTRAIAFDLDLAPVASASVPLETRHPQPGWVEQDPKAILDSVVEVVACVLAEVGGPNRILAAGLDNQGETVVAWSADDGRPLAPAIVWQCRRSLPIVERLTAAGLAPSIRSRTGLPLDPYFSAGKLTWLLEEDAAVRAAAADGTLRLGTVDAWLTARLGAGHPRTDPSTASRTQLLDLARLTWDPGLLEMFGVPAWTLPALVPTTGDLGTLEHSRWRGSLDLAAMVCDQQAALAGHGAFQPGAAKATYGTGVFVLANAGERREATDGLETSIAWSLSDGTTAAVLQGGVFTAGAFLDWLRDDLALIDDVAATEHLAREAHDTAGVRVLPALAGVGAPWYEPEARAVIAGLTGAAGQGQLVRATFDGIAHRVCDVVDAINAALPMPPPRLRVDGGLTANGYLMQRQADLLGIPVEIAAMEESTALGTAVLAGIGAGVLDASTIGDRNPSRVRLEPNLGDQERESERRAWRRFVETASAL